MSTSEAARIADLEATVRIQAAMIDTLMRDKYTSTSAATATPIATATSEYMARIHAYGERSLEILLRGEVPPPFQHRPPAAYYENDGIGK